MPFSKRTPDDLSSNPITKAIERASGRPVLDLTESNPTRCGFQYPSSLLQPLSDPASLVYDPHPFGLPQARKAVADYLNSRGQRVDPDQVILTASTSEAYSYLFKLLGNAGDSFLVPTPGYPLLDHLLHLEGLELVPFPFKTAPGWPVDWEHLEKAPNPRCKGLVVVNPHNPTGTFLSDGDQKALGKLCEDRQWAYISDEVFADCTYPGQGFKPWAPAGTLSFRLGGLSKSLGLPQLKLSWIVLDGPQGLLKECHERLELIVDTYLSVNTPVQLALKDLLGFAPAFQKQLLDRVLENRGYLAEKLEGRVDSVLWPAQGGWYALVEVKGKKANDEKIVLELLEKQGVLVQPGLFYDFPQGCFLVLSLLPRTEVFQEGVVRMKTYLEKG